MQPLATITLRIILEHPTTGVDFGLQKGSGSRYTTVQVQRSNGNNLVFTCTVNVKENGTDFSGLFVQGPKGTRFLYIDIGTCAGQKDTPWSRRLKIPLNIERLTSSSDGQYSDTEQPVHTFQTTIPGTGKDGSPSCGTVKPFGGWIPIG